MGEDPEHAVAILVLEEVDHLGVLAMAAAMTESTGPPEQP
jgi:hypothetical protein